MRILRDNRYTYVFHPTDVDEFCDLEQDPAEPMNLIGSNRETELGPKYRKVVFDTFNARGDRLLGRSSWMKRHLA